MPIGRSRPPHAPRPQARHRRRSARPLMLRPARIAAVLAAVVVLTAVGGVSHLSSNVSTAPLRAEPTGSSAVEQGDGAVEQGDDLDILLLGSDSRDLEDASFGAADGSRRSDAMVLAHLSAENDRIDVVQLPRDTLMTLPACPDTGSGAFSGGRGMLNSALNFGAACSVAAVEELTGLRIDHFVELDFEGFIGIVDALGGVPVCLESAMDDPAADLDLPAGPQTVDGKDALALARTRHAVGDGSDIARLGHQQMVMSALVQEATSRHLLARPDTLYSFLDASTSALTVDPGLSSLVDMTSLGRRAAQVEPENVTFMTMPWQPDPSDPNRVVPSPEAAAVFENLAADAPITAPTSDGPGEPAPDGASSPPGTADRSTPTPAPPSTSEDQPDGRATADAETETETEAETEPETAVETRTADRDLCAP